MRKSLGDDQVRVNVRLPKQLYDALLHARLGLPQRNQSFLSAVLRDALRHYLDCPRLQPARRAKRAEQERIRALSRQPLPGEAVWTAQFKAMYEDRSTS